MNARFTARGLSRRFRGGAGVHGIDLHVEVGQIHALVGLNGAGKSTLMRLLMGMLRPDTGTVHIAGMILKHAARTRGNRTGNLRPADPARLEPAPTRPIGP